MTDLFSGGLGSRHLLPLYSFRELYAPKICTDTPNDVLNINFGASLPESGWTYRNQNLLLAENVFVKLHLHNGWPGAIYPLTEQDHECLAGLLGALNLPPDALDDGAIPHVPGVPWERLDAIRNGILLSWGWRRQMTLFYAAWGNYSTGRPYTETFRYYDLAGELLASPNCVALA